MSAQPGESFSLFLLWKRDRREGMQETEVNKRVGGMRRHHTGTHMGREWAQVERGVHRQANGRVGHRARGS